MSLSKFAVVTFTEENDSVFVVPLQWVEKKDQGTVCAWPKTKNTIQITKMAKCSLPSQKSWIRYPAKVVRKSRTFEKAEQKMKQYQICSEHENVSSTDIENDKECFGSGIVQNVLQECNIENSVFQSLDLPPVPRVASLSLPCTSCIQTQEYVKEILSVLNKLTNEVKELSAIVYSQMNVQPEERPEIDFLPLKTVSDLKNLNESIKEEKEFARLVKFLSLMGGKDEKEATRRVLTKLIDHQLALQLTWAGSETKEAFSVFKDILQLVAVCVRKNHAFHSCTQATVEDAVKRWLRNAADREGGRMKRKRTPTNKQINSDE